MQFQLKSPEPLLYHNEPIWRGDSLVGYIRSGMFGHTLGAAVGLGYVTEPRRRLSRPTVRWMPTPTRSRWPASGNRRSPRCGPFTTRRTCASSAEERERCSTSSHPQPRSPSSLIADLAAHARSGYSLDQRFYCDDEVFAADMREIVMRKWIVAGHIDQVRRKGDYFLFKIGGESIIIVRSDETTINAFYNVCRHRGSVICTEPHGRVARLTCPYHAWSYGLDGALLAARLMPVDFAKEENGLHRCHVRVFNGFIFINLSEQEPVDFDATFGDLAPYLDFHGFADAKVAYSRSYPTDANWKLVVENFVECYHCAPSHPEFVFHASAAGPGRLRRRPELGSVPKRSTNTCRRSRPGRNAPRRSAAPSARSMTGRSHRI